MQLGRDHAEREGAALAQRHGHRRFGQQGVVDATHQQQLHGVHRAGDIAQLEVLANVQPGAFGEQAEQHVGHVAAKRHGDFLAAEILDARQSRFARHHPQQPPGGDIQQAYLGAAVVQVGGDVDRHGQHVGLAIEGHQAQLVRVAPTDELDRVGQIGKRAGLDHVDQRVGYRRQRPGQQQPGQLVRQRRPADQQQGGAQQTDRSLGH
ncbi:hypothetical protein D3C77_520470 [compost metagenome]